MAASARADEGTAPPVDEGTAPPASERWYALWPWWLAPPFIVAGVVLWLWLGGDGSFTEAGRYTLS
ncbi:MAG: hypothetical protein R3F49_01875 [Planctomycetota bacterium]